MNGLPHGMSWLEEISLIVERRLRGCTIDCLACPLAAQHVPGTILAKVRASMGAEQSED